MVSLPECKRGWSFIFLDNGGKGCADLGTGFAAFLARGERECSRKTSDAPGLRIKTWGNGVLQSARWFPVLQLDFAGASL